MRRPHPVRRRRYSRLNSPLRRPAAPASSPSFAGFLPRLRRAVGAGLKRSPAPRLRAERWLAGACLLVGLTVGVLEPAFAGRYYLECPPDATSSNHRESPNTIVVTEGESFDVVVRHERASSHGYGGWFDTIAGTAGTNDYVNVVNTQHTWGGGDKGRVRFHTKQDDLDESDETFTITMRDYWMRGGKNDRCHVTIKDDDTGYSGSIPTFASGALVSNAGKSSDDTVSMAHDVAQAFTTGSHAPGYDLTGVWLALRGGTGTPVYTVSIAEANWGGLPGTVLRTLTNPTSQSGDHNALFTTSSAVTLKANTTYWVVLDVSTADSTTLVWGTNSNQRDGGAAAGWTIANYSASRSSGSNNFLTRSPKVKFAIRGTARADDSPSRVGAAVVANITQTTDSSASRDFNDDHAQAFTTGNHAAGYKLTGASLDIDFSGSASNAGLSYAVHIYSDSSGRPGRSLGTLRRPSALSAGVQLFEASFGGIDLKPGTKYWMVVDASGAGANPPGVKVTTSDAEDTGAAAGWSIANSGFWRDSGGTSWAAMNSSRALKIGIHAKNKRAAPGGGGSAGGGAVVSNIGQADGGNVGFSKDHLQAVNTGSHAGGYTLTGVDLDLQVGSGSKPGYRVELQEFYGSKLLGTLTNPASLKSGTNRFTAAGAGIHLKPSTRYSVVLDVTSGANDNVGWRATNSTGEDAGAAPGWSIDTTLERASAGSNTWVTATKTRKMAVHTNHPGTPPAAPAAPTVSKTDGTRLTVTWAAPEAWPAVSDYDVRYRREGDTAWTEHDHTGTATTATIVGLMRGAKFEAQVRATNREGAGDWSEAGKGHTGAARFLSAQTTSTGEAVYVYFTKDLHRLNRVTDSLDKTNFTVAVDGVDKTPLSKATVRDNRLTIPVSVTDPITRGQTVTVSYARKTTNNILDIDSQAVAGFTNMPVRVSRPGPPDAPLAPSVAAVTDALSLSVNWIPPDINDSPLTDYDVRYYAGSADPTDEDDWIEAGDTGGHDHVGLGTSATLSGLATGSAYRVQVRATNYHGTGDWSESGSATVGTGPPLVPGGLTVAAVSNSASTLSVSWTAPGTGGSAITDYDLRYYAGSADPDDEADWVTEDETTGLSDTDSVTTSATISGLAPSTAYRVQVRAGNAVGEGAWSASGTATTNASTSTTNQAPIRMKLGSSGCVQKTEDTSFGTINAPAGTLISATPLVDNTKCTGSGRKAPMFSDPDGDTLTFTARVSNVPDTVILGYGIPHVELATATQPGRVYVVAAASRTTSVRIDVTATDPEGASVSTFFHASVGGFGNSNGAPTFSRQQEALHFAVNEKIDPVVLPPAEGGDVGSVSSTGDFRFPYKYRVEGGLPPGLSFDGETRALTGTPTGTGTFEVTYTASDVDGVGNAADKARQTFSVRVGHGPTISRVHIVSHPSYDADGDGTNDTYVRGDRILVDVEFGGQAVKLSGAKDVKLRLDLGDDNANQNDGSRRLLSNPELLHGNETLRFAYVVQAADRDPDGVWVQTGAARRVLFTPLTTITDADTGLGVDPTLQGLPITGNEFAKVDGSKTSADVGPRPTGAAVDGAALTVTFDQPLASLSGSALTSMRFYLLVQGAGGLNAGDRTLSQSPIAVGVSGSTLTLTLGTPARAGDDNIRLTYDGALLKGTGTPGKKVAWFRDLAVTNNMAGAVGPAPLRATVGGDRLRLIFDGALDATSVPSGSSAFVVTTTDANDDRRSIAGKSGNAFPPQIDGAVVDVYLDEAVPGDVVASVSYTKPAANPLKGAGTGNPEVRSFDGFRATVFDRVAPVLLGAAVAQVSASPARTKLALYYDKALDAASVPSIGDFGLTAEGGATVWQVAVEGKAVVLTLDGRAPAGRTFIVSYTPGTNLIQDEAGNAATKFRQVLIAKSPEAPVAQSAVVDGARVVLTYDRALDPASLPAPAAFTVHDALEDSEREADRELYDLTVTRVELADRRRVVLHLRHPLHPCEDAAPFTLAYDVPDESPLQGLDGADVSDFFGVPVTNARAGACSRNGILSATVGGSSGGVGSNSDASSVLRGRHAFATGSAPQAAWFTVSASGGAAAVTGASFSSDDPRELRLTLDRDIAAGETVTVSYRRPRGALGLSDVHGSQLANVIDMAVANSVPRPANVAATGAPAIEGTARVGETLAATTAGIADANGLSGAAFAFQWVSSGDGADAVIAGATGARYTLTEAEEGRTVKVRVTFSDDAGYRETLTSAATGAVAPLLPPLTATFTGVPAEHDGRRLFSFELRFSEDFPGRFGYRVLRDHAFVVTGGRVREAKRIARGRNDRWTISVRPASFEDVTITLPAATDCGLPGAVCTEAGRKLANTVSATVGGPATLSVADAEAREGADEAMAFRVTLGRAVSGTVTVDYATADGTAVAGEDYTRTQGTLSFAQGELEKTVSVPILDDALDEGSETFTLRLRNAQGAAIADGEATGTITNADPLQKMWLSRFGRTVAGHVTEAVSDRLAGPLSGAQVTVGGVSVDLAETQDEAWLGQTLTSVAQALGAPAGPEPEDDPGSGSGAGGWRGTGVGVGESPAPASTTMRELSGRELLLGSAFHLAREGDGGGPGLAAWGRVTVGGFDGAAPAETGNVRVDGEVTTGILGTDAEWERLLAGVAISVSEGEGRFDQPEVDSGTVESTMTTVSPYARFMVTDRVSVWGLAGWGTGDMTIVQAANDRGQPERTTRTDLEMRLAALGGRGALLTQDETGVMDLALKADAFHVETESDPVSNEGKTTAEANRVRLILEGGRAFQTGGGAVLRPSLELGLRHDGGDAETGTGVELGGGVSYADPATGLSVEAKARMLVAHADSDYEEWGVSGAVRLAPNERGRGLSFSLSPTLGAAAGGSERLWGAQRAAELAPGGAEFEAARGLQGELGYGLSVLGDRFTGTPNLGFALSDAAREYRIGWRLTSVVPGDPGFEIGLDAVRQEPVNDNGAGRAEHGVMLRGAIRW